MEIRCPQHNGRIVPQLKEGRIEFEESTRSGVYYTVRTFSRIDFNGNAIPEEHEPNRTAGLYLLDVENGVVSELVRRGAYDIADIFESQGYVHFVMVRDRDGDGLLGESDYPGTDICRVHIATGRIEHCFSLNYGNFCFHGFELATEECIVFRSEDCIPNTTQIVIVDVYKQNTRPLKYQMMERRTIMSLGLSVV